MAAVCSSHRLIGKKKANMRSVYVVVVLLLNCAATVSFCYGNESENSKEDISRKKEAVLRDNDVVLREKEIMSREEVVSREEEKELCAADSSLCMTTTEMVNHDDGVIVFMVVDRKEDRIRDIRLLRFAIALHTLCTNVLKQAPYRDVPIVVFHDKTVRRCLSAHIYIDG